MWPRKNELEGRFKEIIQNMGARNRKHERLEDMNEKA